MYIKFKMMCIDPSLKFVNLNLKGKYTSKTHFLNCALQFIQ